MQEKISIFKKDLDNIELVLSKLKEKQNSSVFDKLCVKCNALLENISNEDPLKMNIMELEEMISFLKRFRSVAKTLQEYKLYLINVIEQNINLYEETKEEVTLASDQELAIIDNDEILNSPVNDVYKLIYTKDSQRAA